MELRQIARYKNAKKEVNPKPHYDNAPLQRYELSRVIRAELARGKDGSTERSRSLQEHFRRMSLYGEWS